MAAHRYWRLRIHSTWSGNAVTSVATLTGWAAGHIDDQLLASLGPVCTATSHLPPHVPARANDNNLFTAWITQTFADPTDLKVDFGATPANWRDIRQIRFTSRYDAFWLCYPRNIEWQWSDDDISYTTTIGPLDTPVPTGPGQYYTSPSIAPAELMRSTKADMLLAVNFPTNGIRATLMPELVAASSTSGMDMRTSSGYVLAAAASTSGMDLRTSNAVVLVAVRGRVSNPKLRAWTFTLDGHDFYVLRLGMDLTLVYDVYSQQWMDWDAFELLYWPVNIGINWVGGVGLLDDEGESWGSNILVGDDTLGLLWFLDPKQPFDESFDGPLDPEPAKYFPRVTMGQLALTGRQVLPCYSAWLTTDMGEPAYVGAGVTLEISDDAGKTFEDMGTVTVTPGDNRPELSWYSLGQIEAPGRLFRITDDGAVTRIDGMEMNDPDDEK